MGPEEIQVRGKVQGLLLLTLVVVVEVVVVVVVIVVVVIVVEVVVVVILHNLQWSTNCVKWADIVLLSSNDATNTWRCYRRA